MPDDPLLSVLLEGAEAVGAPLDAEGGARLLAYLDAILLENEKVNLTAIRDREEAVVRHLLDSLSLGGVWLRLTEGRAPRRVLDVGTGGGFPAAPLAVLWPGTRVVAIDGTGKKVAAVERACAATGIPNVEAVHCRAGDLQKYRRDLLGAFDLVAARAVGQVARILPELRGLLSRGGRALLMKGPDVPREELVLAKQAARRLGFVSEPWRKTDVPGLERRTVLIYSRRAAGE